MFLARAPSLGFAVYDVRPAARPAATSALDVTPRSLENARYRVRIDAAGDVASILDKALGRDLLAGPARLALLTEQPRDWPAWNMDWSDQRSPPRGYVQGPATVRVLERGPARVALEVDRTTEGSRFVQTIRLSAGDAGNRVEFEDSIDWRTPAAALKASFPLSAANPDATYDWGAGTVVRGNDEAARFEVGSHRWFDLTDRSGAWGTTVLSDCKTGSDKPDDHTLRLTLLYTPGLGTGLAAFYPDQASQDWGHHELAYGLAGHTGGWRHSGTGWQAYRLNVPLVAFVASRHAGPLGKSFSMLRVTSDHVRVMALKKAEEGDEIVVRIVEMEGEPARDVRLVFAAPVLSAREVDGQERPLGGADADGGALVTALGPFQIRTFAVKLGGRPAELAPPRGEPLALPCDLAASSADGTAAGGGFSATGEALPSELLPERIDYRGVDFRLAPGGAAAPDAVVARGQTLRLPAGRFDRVYVLAASAGGDRKALFRVGAEGVERTIEDWGGYLGQWDRRLWKDVDLPLPPESVPGQSRLAARQWARVREYEKLHGPIRVPGFAGLAPGYIKRSPVAWFASHRHTAEGRNEPYAYAYLFAQEIELPPGATTLTLPDDDRIRILAATAVQEPTSARPAQPLYDDLGEAPPTPGTPAGPESGMSTP